MKTVKTPSGTELPIRELKGKDYLDVKYRVVWFREEHPDWSIETAIVLNTKDAAMARAEIKDPAGRIMSTGHKFEDREGFKDFREKAETGAIGRALALIGYGTQFTDDLEEGERIVDSPTEKRVAVVDNKVVRPQAFTGPSSGKAATDKQQKFIYAKLMSHPLIKGDNEALKEFVLKHTGKTSTRALTMDDVNTLVKAADMLDNQEIEKMDEEQGGSFESFNS